MTPHKHSAGGTLMIDRSFRGIGRIHRASGMTDARTFRAFNDALTEMAKESAGREWIRALQRGDAEPLDAWAKYKTGKWRTPPTAGATGNLVDAITKWREDHKPRIVNGERLGVSEDTYRVRNELITKVREHARAGAAVDELPTVLRAIKAAMANAPASFNLLRNYARAFLRDTVGKRHELYQIVRYDVGPIAIPRHAKKKERKRHPLSPAQVLVLASKFSTRHPGGAEGAEGHGYNAIQIALLGMNPKEYFVDGWSQAPTFVKIHGEKRGGRDRIVPKLFPSKLWPHAILKRPTITKHSFERAFAAARKEAKLDCSPLDLRRSLANWMESAGVERTLRRMILGHGARNPTDFYETKQLREHIEAVGKTMRAWIDQQLEQRPRLVADDAR